jgi:hypothetical protein
VGAGESTIEQRYAYVAPSGVADERGAATVQLATSSPNDTHPWLVTATMSDPPTVAAGLLVLATVARSRFYVPAATIARILELADPVVTSHGDRLRAEAFSACCGVYARLDVLPAGLEIETAHRATTNVDIGVGLRRALGQLPAGGQLRLSVGGAGIGVDAGGLSMIERRVRLPARWVKGLAEVQLAERRMAHVFTISGAEFRRFIRTVPAAGRNHAPSWVQADRTTIRLTGRPSGTAAALGGADRLRVAAPIAAKVRTVAVYGDDHCSAWVLDLGTTRLTLVFSPSAARGFSGEGSALEDLVGDADIMLAALVSTAVDLDGTIDPARVAAAAGLSNDDAVAGLRVLAAQGDLGFDVVEGAFFHRPLPLDAVRATRHPRLAEAEKLVANGAVRILGDGANRTEAEVSSGGVVHHVILGAFGDRCTCPWYGRHQGERGPCKHVLAVRLGLSQTDG